MSNDRGQTWTERLGTVHSLNKVVLLDADHGLAVGSYGTVVRTTNGGQLWAGVPSGTVKTLRALEQVTASQVVAVGDSGTILRSEDRGEHWISLDPLTHHRLNEISVISSGTGIAVGDSGTVLRTSDGGRHWSSLPELGGAQLHAAHMFSDSVILAAGGGPGWIFRSSDGGQSWSQTIIDTLGEITSFSFCDSVNGLASTSGHILITSDGGQTWMVRQLCCTREVQMVSTTLAFAVGVSPGGGHLPDVCEIFRSTDGGTTWSGELANTFSFHGPNWPFYNYLTDVDFDGSNNGTAVGTSGLIFRTTNAGTTWVEEGPRKARIPTETTMEQNYPNPFNPTTVVSYQLSVISRVDLRIFDLLGREVGVLVNEEKPPGTYKATWDAKGIASGVYFYQLRVGGEVMTKKAILLR
jgi:photosystem II stability/assembly factor-like uncharacterized protein